MGCFASTAAIPGTYVRVFSPLLAAPNQYLINKWDRLEMEKIFVLSTRNHYASYPWSL